MPSPSWEWLKPDGLDYCKHCLLGNVDCDGHRGCSLMESPLGNTDCDGHKGHSLMHSSIRNVDCDGHRGHSLSPLVNGDCEGQEVVH
jgi:hypothetical protein